MGACAMVSAATGTLIAIQRAWQAYLLFGTFIVASVIQYFYNSTYSDTGNILV